MITHVHFLTVLLLLFLPVSGRVLCQRWQGMVLRKNRCRARNLFVYKIYIATMMIPGQVTLIPLFIIMRELGWLNTYQALVIPMAGAFGVMMMRSFIKSVPDELVEAAQN